MMAVAIKVSWGALVETLVEQGFAVFSINPKQVDRLRDRFTVAGAKDDSRDALVLASSLRTDRKSFRLVEVDSPEIIRLRELSRFEEEVKNELRPATNRLWQQLHRYYPQVLTLSPAADDLFIWDLVRHAPTPAEGARLTQGLSISAAYTWSKSVDNFPAELENTGINPQNGRDLRSLRAVSDLNIPQRFVASYVLELPFGKGKPFLTGGVGSALLGGWRTSGVYTFSSGLPFTVTSGGNYDNAIDQFGAASSLPNVIGTPTIVGSTDCWFYVSSNPACIARKPSQPDAFALQQVGQFGNAGRNILKGPHTNVFDFALMRDFRLIERLNLQARWEVFNAANTPLFAFPDSTPTDGSVGRISSLSGDPRGLCCK